MSFADMVEPRNSIGPHKQCVSCGNKGHTYLACTTRPFWPTLAREFGIGLPQGLSNHQSAQSTEAIDAIEPKGNS